MHIFKAVIGAILFVDAKLQEPVDLLCVFAQRWFHVSRFLLIAAVLILVPATLLFHAFQSDLGMSALEPYFVSVTTLGLYMYFCFLFLRQAQRFEDTGEVERNIYDNISNRIWRVVVFPYIFWLVVEAQEGYGLLSLIYLLMWLLTSKDVDRGDRN